MRYFLVFIFVLGSLLVYSQTLSIARKNFNNFEYGLAAQLFQDVYDKQGLEPEDLKRIVYSYYVTGDFVKCQPLIDILLTQGKVEPKFYLISGEVNCGIGNYSKAIKSYETYQAMNGDEDVSIKIQSCKEIPNWGDEAHVSFGPLPSNNEMADLSGEMFNGGVIRFSEIGYNKMKKLLGVIKDDNDSMAQLFLAQPKILNQNKEYVNVFMKDSSLASISSIAFLPKTHKALLTIAYPLSPSPLKKAQNLYWATLDSDFHFQDVYPFEYSGLSDSSSTAHATINSAGNIIIFIKSGKNTHGADLYLCEKKEGKWGLPKPIDAINTNGDEMFPMFNGDSVLSFSSDGRVGYGGLDIYSVHFPIQDQVKFKHLKSPINSIEDDFNLTYVTKDSAIFVSNRHGGKGDDDLYYITFKKDIIIPVDTFYVDAYIAQWKTRNVYFNFDEFMLEKSLSQKDINDLKIFLSKCPSCVIHLTGYTDSRGSEKYNLKLSERRTLEVQNKLIKEGFEIKNIEVTAKGENNQPYDCGKDCSEEEHKLNRVVQIDIQKR